MFRSLGFVCLFMAAAVAQAATMPEVPTMPAFPRPIRTVLVNCNAGQKIQTAIDGNAGPVEIIVSGICVETVLIRDKDVKLRGTKPSIDGIRSTDPATPALTVRGAGIDVLENLSFSNSAGTAVVLQGAMVTLTNCAFENNGNRGLQINTGTLAMGTGLAFNGNIGPGVNVNNGQFFCTGCDVSGNNFAAQGIRGAVVSFLGSMITSRLGILSGDGGSIVDLDCVNTSSTHACGMQASAAAAVAVGGGLATLFGAGDFTGRLVAIDAGTVALLGSRQIAGAQPGQGPPFNEADFFGRIEVGTLFDVNPPVQSKLLSTNAAHFGRVLVTDDTIVSGAIRCSSAGDAFLDPTIIALPGSTVTGCEHSSLP